MSTVHGKLSRVQKPRVHITYEVENSGATETKDLAFLIGVVGDFSGRPMQRNKDGQLEPAKLKPLKDRKFVNIESDNLNEVLKQMTPGLSLELENTLAGDGSVMKVNLGFESLKDFEPTQVAHQIDPVRKLLELRNQLSDLLSKVGNSTDLESTLEKVLENTENVDKLADELGIKEDEQ